MYLIKWFLAKRIVLRLLVVHLSKLHAIKGNIDIRKAKPVGSLKEEDPLMDCLRTEQPDEVANLIKDDAKPAKQGTSKVNEEKHKTENGEIEIKQYAIKCSKRQNKKLPCSTCAQVFGLVKDFNIHMKEKHPDVKF